MTLPQFTFYILSVSFRPALTMPQSPHEYIVCHVDSLGRDLFEQAVLFVREHGKPELYEGKEYTYYHHNDGYKYWTMGDPMETTFILNRAKV